MSQIHIVNYHTETILAVLQNKIGRAVYWDDEHRISLENNEETFDFTMNATIPEAAHVSKKNIVLIQDEDGNYREFIIYNTFQHGEEKDVKANASYSELAKQKILDPVTLTGYSAKAMAEYVLQGTDWKLGRVEYTGNRTYSWYQHTDALTAIKDVAKIFDLEIRFVVEVRYNKIVGRYVDLIRREGRNIGKEVVLGKDLIGVRREETTDIVTGLVGLGPERSNGTRPIVRVTDEDAVARWGKNGRHLWDIYEPDISLLALDGINLLSGTKDFHRFYWNTDDIGVQPYERDPEFKQALIKGLYPNCIMTEMDLQKFKFEADKFYAVSAWFRSDIAGQQVGITVGYGERTNWNPKPVGQHWIRHSWIVQGDEASANLQYFRFESSTASEQNPIYVAQIKVEEGTQSTDWLPEADERLEEVTRQELERRVNSSVRYEADAVSIEEIFGMSHEATRIGDTIRVKDTSYEPPLYLEARVIELSRSISNKSSKTFILGDFIEYTEDEVMNRFNILRNLLYEKASIHKGPFPPEPPYFEGQIWIDTSDPSQDIWKSWDSGIEDWREGPGGPPGPQGPPGKDGEDGQTFYTWIMYADDAAGSNMSQSPEGKAYIGIAYNKPIPTPSHIASDYSWSLIKGSDGLPGPPGEDGKSTYTWVKYADDEEGNGMDDDPTGKMYIGLAFNKDTPTESDDPQDYTWSAMYDIDLLNSKAEIDDLDNLATIITDVAAELENKAPYIDFEQLRQDYNQRWAQREIDKQQVTSMLQTLEGRTALAEEILGEHSRTTQFIETVITEAEEGIYISNKNSATGILISDDRISFMDNNVEVAYISNQTMEINHGIFVESAVIADFKFEKLPGTDILVVTWVGD